ncbi:MAG: FadR family transcriptional regulator [Clostridiales bacterium]|nr:FadR family transcriptional regulator [Clostridiales bacterium]
MTVQAKTLAEKVSDEILRLIQDRPFLPGEKLPTEKELCEMLGVGRNTVREALKILTSKNIITIRQGAGTYISEKQGVADDPLGFAMVADRKKLTVDLLQLRLIIEPPVAGLAAQEVSEKDIVELQEILEEMEDQIRRRQDFTEADCRFHEKIADCTGNTVMGNLIPVIMKGIQVFAGEVSETDYEQTRISHRKIYESIRDHRSFEAEMEMRFHLLYNHNRYQNS